MKSVLIPLLVQLLRKGIRQHDCAKWTVVTYLPFLWRPEEHMYLKPEATKDFAERVGHSFANEYSAHLDIHVYDALLALAKESETEVEQLNPRDRIDIQSFIWVVGSYTEKPKPSDL